MLILPKIVTSFVFECVFSLPIQIASRCQIQRRIFAFCSVCYLECFQTMSISFLSALCFFLYVYSTKVETLILNTSWVLQECQIEWGYRVEVGKGKHQILDVPETKDRGNWVVVSFWWWILKGYVLFELRVWTNHSAFRDGYLETSSPEQKR